MKKIFSTLLITALLLGAMMLTACDLSDIFGGGTDEHVHVYEDTVVEPTCTDRGYTEHVCECGYVMRDTFVEPHNEGHKYERVETVAPTCTADGYTKDVCAYCFDEVVEVIDAAHDMNKSYTVVVQPTCTTPGEERKYCKNCAYYESREVPTRHNYEVLNAETDVVLPTCTESGYSVMTCVDCGHQKNDKFVKPTGHAWILFDEDEWVTGMPGDCTHYAEEYRKCDTCGFIEKKYANDFAHAYTTVVTEPTCTELGYTTYTCTLCGYVKVDDYTAPAHAFGEWEVYVGPSCTAYGLSRRTCTNCSFFEESLIEPQHYYDVIDVVEPTKTTSGYTQHSCDCGLFYRDTFVSATGSEGLEYEARKLWDDETASYIEYAVVIGLGTCTDTEVAIPLTVEIDGKVLPVTVISYQALYNRDEVTDVYISINVTKFDVAAFWNCDNLVTFHYDGTVDQWNALNKGNNWDNGLGEYVVVCADGTIEK